MPWPETQGPISKLYMAQRVLRRAAEGERHPGRLRFTRAAAFRIILTPQAGETPAVKRTRIARIMGQRRVVIGNRLLEPAELQIGEAAAIEGGWVIGGEAQRFV